MEPEYPVRSRTSAGGGVAASAGGGAMNGGRSRLMIAGTGGDCGKTILSLGLLSLWRRDGRQVAAFKKGPDFIDAAWLGWAAGAPGRNLDTYLMGPEIAARSFAAHAAAAGPSLIEGNRGLLDGVDAGGTHSSAGLARLLECPVVLVLSPRKMTATAAAVVAGLKLLAPDVTLAGVILNRVAGARHESVVRQAIEELGGVPVLGALPELPEGPLTSRHLGLVPPREHGASERLRDTLADLAARYCDVARLIEIADGAPPPTAAEAAGGLVAGANGGAAAEAGEVRIGFFDDSAFTFYYPENLEALTAAGARLLPISALADRALPALDALYIGGGFPETHARQLAANRPLLAAVKEAARQGLPIYAECGGLMFLAESLQTDRQRLDMAGVLPIRVKMHPRPQGHGYCRMRVEAANPVFPVGTELVGHEFHYSGLEPDGSRDGGPATAYAVIKGRGCGGGRDGIVHGNVLASYLHLHALGTPAWAPGLVTAARRHRQARGRA